MARYTLPSGTTTETITFSVPHPDDQNQLPLTVHMGFDADRTGTLRMTGYGENSNFSDGLVIHDKGRALTTLTFQLAKSWPDSDAWSITVDGDSTTNVLSSTNPKYEYTLQPGWIECEISLTITHTLPDGKVLSTGDPKIKVIRPSS